MDRARLSLSGCPHLPPRQARLLQLGRFVGRRDAGRVGSSGIGFQSMISNHGQDARAAHSQLANYFGEGAGPAPPACGVFPSITSTPKIRTEFGGFTRPPASPWSRLPAMY